ncbi:MAG: lysylphosphatidylglycerol synthase transmembrane domain-containing protein [Verrucomicrobiota bacterium]
MSARRKIWNIAWRLVLCAALLTWIFHSIFVNEGRLEAQRDGVAWDSLARAEQWRIAWTHGPAALWQTLRLVEPFAMALSVVLMGSTVLLGVIRWRMVLKVQGLELPFSRAGEISLIAHFFNSFLLGSTGGDLLKAYYAARETHHLKTEAVTTVFVDRLIGLFAMLLFASLMMLPNMGLLASHHRLWTVGALVLGMLGACAVLVYLAFWGGVTRGFPQAREWLRKLPKGEHLERSLEACRRFGKEPAFLLKAMLLSMALNALCVLQLLVLARGLGMTIPTLPLFFIVPSIICIAALPITPSGLGVRENLFVLLLAVPHIAAPETQSLSLSLLAYAGSLFWSIVGGVVYLSIKQSQHLDEVTDADAANGG